MTPTTVTGIEVNEDSGAYLAGANFALPNLGQADENAGGANEQAVDDYLVSNDNAALFLVAPDIANDGTLTFTPADNAHGSATVTVQVRDNGGTADGGDDLSQEVTFEINVNSVNDVPGFTKGADQVVFRGDGAQTVTGWATAMSKGPANESGQILTFNVTANDPSLFSVQPAIDAATGELSYTPNPNNAGTATVSVTISDDGGTANGGVDTSAAQTFSIRIDSTRIYIPDLSSAGPGATVTVPLNIDAFGTENGVSLSVSFDTAVLSYVGAALHADASALSGALLPNETDAANGNVGLAVVLPQLATFTALTDQGMVDLTFTVQATAPLGSSPIALTGAPIIQEVTDTNADPLSLVDYDDGEISIEQGTKEGDVAVRPNGDGNVSVTDMTQIGRFVAGLDIAAEGEENGEFQRADTAPRSTGGNGLITVSDWVQVGRYAAGFDRVDHDNDSGTPAEIPDAFGPVGAGISFTSFGMPTRARVMGLQTSRSIHVSGALQAGTASAISVMMNSLGDEAGVSFTLEFDPTVLNYTGSSLGTGVPGAMLIVNDSAAAFGRVGVVLALTPGASISAGAQQLLQVGFTVASDATENTVIRVSGNSPVAREVSGTQAQVLPANFNDATLPIALPPGFAAGRPVITPEGVRFTFGHEDGSPVTAAELAELEVYAASDIRGAWVKLEDELVLVDGNVQIVDPDAANGLRFYQVRRAAASGNGGGGQQNQ